MVLVWNVQIHFWDVNWNETCESKNSISKFWRATRRKTNSVEEEILRMFYEFDSLSHVDLYRMNATQISMKLGFWWAYQDLFLDFGFVFLISASQTIVNTWTKCVTDCLVHIILKFQNLGYNFDVTKKGHKLRLLDSLEQHKTYVTDIQPANENLNLILWTYVFCFFHKESSKQWSVTWMQFCC